eukprot:TRINITY_DN15915_c0_g1_i1.p1 TRINITY_DN15915_c0_g1~~TRINITY_DN15915_c0_g1_i1.p1  ORF type:complete len:897 (+),score=151.62 TRINITY_DN15915_c0_g1_i1:192-2882(+)
MALLNVTFLQIGKHTSTPPLFRSALSNPSESADALLDSSPIRSCIRGNSRSSQWQEVRIARSKACSVRHTPIGSIMPSTLLGSTNCRQMHRLRCFSSVLTDSAVPDIEKQVETEAERLHLDELARENMRLRALGESSVELGVTEGSEEPHKSSDETTEAPGAWKWGIRKKIWDLLEEKNLAQKPRPVHHRIPNFSGAQEAADMLLTLPEFKAATCVKVNPDTPQKAVRLGTLTAGKVLLVPQPRLRTGFFARLDPAQLKPEQFADACTPGGAAKLCQPVDLLDKIKVDMVVVGSVAVDPKTGARLGKGEGFAELEYGMLRWMGAIDDNTPIVTTVRDEQLVDGIPSEKLLAHDVAVDIICTPTQIIRVQKSPIPKPTGIYWDKLSPEKLAQVRILQKLKAHIEATTGETLPSGPSAPLPPTAARNTRKTSAPSARVIKDKGYRRVAAVPELSTPVTLSDEAANVGQDGQEGGSEPSTEVKEQRRNRDEGYRQNKGSDDGAAGLGTTAAAGAAAVGAVAVGAAVGGAAAVAAAAVGAAAVGAAVVGAASSETSDSKSAASPVKKADTPSSRSDESESEAKPSLSADADATAGTAQLGIAERGESVPVPALKGSPRKSGRKSTNTKAASNSSDDGEGTSSSVRSDSEDGKKRLGARAGKGAKFNVMKYTNRLFVRNLDDSTHEPEIYQLIEEATGVRPALVGMFRLPNRETAMARVAMPLDLPQGLQSIVDAIDGAELHGKRLKVHVDDNGQASKRKEVRAIDFPLRVFVRQLNFDATEEQLGALFKETCGFAAEKVEILKVSDLSRGLARIALPNGSNVDEVVEKFNGSVLLGRSIRVTVDVPGEKKKFDVPKPAMEGLPRSDVMRKRWSKGESGASSGSAKEKEADGKINLPEGDS